MASHCGLLSAAALVLTMSVPCLSISTCTVGMGWITAAMLTGLHGGAMQSHDSVAGVQVTKEVWVTWR